MRRHEVEPPAGFLDITSPEIKSWNTGERVNYAVLRKTRWVYGSEILRDLLIEIDSKPGIVIFLAKCPEVKRKKTWDWEWEMSETGECFCYFLKNGQRIANTALSYSHFPDQVMNALVETLERLESMSVYQTVLDSLRQQKPVLFDPRR